MHELSIACSLVQLAEARAQRAGAKRVTRLNCRIGALRQIEDELMRGAFDCARQGTLCREAELVIEKIPLRAHCSRCRRPFAVDQWNWNCPICGADGQPLPGGDELDLTSIDVET